MILVFRSDKDYSSKEVIEWLYYYKSNFLIVNEMDKIEILEIDIFNDNVIYKIGSKKITNNEIDAIWYRGGIIRMFNNRMNVYKKDRVTFEDNLDYFLAAYSKSQYEYIEAKLNSNSKFKIGGNGVTRYNKIIALEMARNAKILIPNTIITGKKSSLINFAKKNTNIITKSLDLNFSFYDKNLNIRFYQYTSKIALDEINKLNDEFPLTIFQKEIPKVVELRVFHICGKNFTVAIYSQNNIKTQIDYRNYDYMEMNRIVRFQLPPNLESKINRFMKLVNLNTGSIDLILSRNSKYYFLEVNPIGQFGYNSRVCNLDIERHIAESLIKMS